MPRLLTRESAIAGSWCPASSRNAVRHQIGTLSGFISEWVSGLDRNPQRRALKVARTDPEPIAAFVPAIVKPEPSPEANAAPRRRRPRQAASGRMVIEVGRGRRVVVDGAVDAEALARVLDVLDRR